MVDDNVQHGIDDNPNNDAEKGATLGGLGGAAVGAAAGSAVGPVGTVVGAVVGGLAGAGASGAAVAAVDQVDNDNTVTGLGDSSTQDVGHAVQDRIASNDVVGTTHTTSTDTGAASVNAAYPTPSTGHAGVSDADVSDVNIDRGIGNDIPNVRRNDSSGGVI